MVKIGLITMGQSPRVDILTDWKFDPREVEEYKAMDILVPPKDSQIPRNIEFIHLGALDDIPTERMNEIKPAPGKSAIISRLRDGSWTLIDHEKLKPLLRKCVERLEKAGCKAILQLCTGKFPYLKPRVPYIMPGILCKRLIESVLSPEGRLGILLPFPTKSGQEKPKRSPEWGQREIFSVNANPYEYPPESITPAVEKMMKKDVEILYMGCLGYSFRHKEIASEILKIPVILPRSVCARTLAELYGF